MVEIVKQYGSERIIVDSSADWGVSDPLSVPKTAALMLERGIAKEDVHLTCYKNALTAYSQSGQMKEEDWKKEMTVEQAALFDGSGILRGQEAKVISYSNIIDN